jgi:ribonuclease T1
LTHGGGERSARIGTLRLMRHVILRRAAAAFAFAALLPSAALPVFARAAPEALAEVPVSALPAEARRTLALIRDGGPFPYERDGIRFGNREKLLPAKPRDYYREYTVKTPGAKNRGARRIVCGGPPRTPDVCYYTGDHYQSFSRIRE